ncbi:MAG: CARDB domain-containing protein, partial [Xanthomonadales bacterium]|nr:CARDB domain-containing protein [Xanthomonadales bacterium]
PTVVGSLPVDFQADVTVRNLGGADAAGVTVSLQRRLPGGVVETLVSQSLDLPARTSAPLNLAAQLTRSGPIELRIAADPQDVLAEPEEDNNILDFDVATADALDLAVLPAEILLLTPTPVAGQDVSFQFTLRNLGTVDAPPVSFVAAVEQGGVTETLLEQVVQLGAGEADQRSLSWRATGVGDARLVVTIDSSQQAVEGDEGNNQGILDFVVGSVSQPNLSVDFEDLVFTPNPGLESQPLTIEIPVSNSSDVAAGPFRVEFYEGVPGEGGVLIESQDLGGLAAGSQQLVQATTAPLSGGGERLFYVVVDSADAVAEFDESDNTAFDQVSVLRLPDLAITPANVLLAPTLPVPGSAIDATVTVDNLGQQPASNVSVAVFEVDAQGGQTPVAGPVSIAQIDPDSSADTVFSWTFGNAGEVDRILVVVDGGDQILEISNANNTAEVRTDLQNQSFFVSERYISPNGDGVQDSTAIGYNPDQPVAGSIVIDDSLGRRVRSISLDNPDRGQVSWNGRGDNGSVVRDGSYQLQLLDENDGLLAQTLVVVDTNRLPLLDAVDTPAAYFTDLRCSAEFVGNTVRFSADGRYLYTTEARDLNGDFNRGLFRIPTRGRGLDPLLSDNFLGQNGTQVGNLSVLPDGRIVFTTGSSRLWIKPSPLAEPLQLDTGGTFSFNLFRAGPDYALIENQFTDDLWKVFYDPGIPAQQIQSPGTNMNYWAEVNGGWLMSRFFGGEFNGENVFGEHLYFVSADPGVAPTEIIFGPEVEFQISPDRRYVAAFASQNQFEFSPPVFGLIRAVRLNGPVPEVYYESGRDFGDYWDINLSYSWGNELLILDGIQARIEVLGPGGAPLGEAQFPTQLAQDYIDVVPFTPASFGPPRPYTAFAGWKRYFDPDNVVNPAVAWSADSGEFFVELALAYPSGGEKAQQDAGEKRVPSNTQFSQFFRVSLDELEPVLVGTINHDADDSFIFPDELDFIEPENLIWLARDDRLLADRFGSIQSIALEPEPSVNELGLGRLGDAWPRDYGSMYRRFFLNTFDGEDNLKCAGQGQIKAFFESADNLIAHLEISRFASVIELNGVAADRNLQSFQLDWAFADDPENWFTLTSASSEKIIDDLLATWVPPQAGSFLVRLTVSDLAGNRGEDIRSVSWLDPANLASVETEPRYISPNGDGIQDQATVSFRVLQPLNLDVTVENSAGQVVRTLSGQYPTVTGDIETLTWDGRNDAGMLVPEGTYLLRVENRRFRVVVDITPPDLALELPRAYQPVMVQNRQLVGAIYELSGILREPNFGQGIIEFRRGNEPWNEFELYAAEPPMGEISKTLEPDLYVPGEFRLSAVDLAGNRAQTNAINLFQDLILKDFRQFYIVRGVDLSDPPERKVLQERLEYVAPPVNPQNFPSAFLPVLNDRIGLVMELTFDQPVDQYFVELAEPGNLSDWVAIPKVPAPAASEENFESPDVVASAYRQLFLLELAELQGLEDVYVRIRADIGGVSYYSNGARLFLDPGLKLSTMRRALLSAQAGELEPIQDVELITRLNQQVSLKDTTITQFWLRESLPGLPANARLLVESQDDERYLNQTAFLPVTDARLDAPSEFSAQLFEVPTSPCRNYQVGWEADFPDGVGGTRPVLFPPINVRRSCLSVESQRYVVPGPFCGETSPGLVQIRVKLETDDPDILPISLDILDRGPGGQEILLSNVVAPEIGRSYSLDIELSSLVSGARSLTARVVDSVGDVVEERIPLPVDRQPPEISLDFPAEGEQLCAVQTQSGAIQLPLEGIITDNFEFAYKALIGSGADTTGLKLIGGTPDTKKVAGGEIGCNLDQTYLREECLDQGSLAGELGLYDFPEEHEFELATGPTTAVIEAMDWSGARYCALNTFELDASVDARVSGTFGLFSPNGDGVLDSASVLVQALEPLTMTVTVHEPVLNSDGQRVAGPLLGELVSAQPVEGDITFVWGGDDGAAVLDDGLYILRFEFTDNCGLVAMEDTLGEIDNTPPDVRIDYPQNGDPLGAVVEVLGGLTDLNFASGNVDYGQDGAWINLRQHDRPVFPSQPMATWVLAGLEAGTFDLRAQARDKAGNEAEVIVGIDLTTITSLIWALQAEPPLFSPNNDGVQDAVRIALGVQDTGLFTIDVETTGGGLVNRLADAQQLNAGTQNFEWDGTDAAGDVVADGDYVIAVTATDTVGSGFSQTERITVTVDTVPPTLVLTRPAGEVVQGRGSYIFQADDEHFAQVRAFEQPIDPPGPESLLLEDLQGGAFTEGDLSALAEGRHAIRLEAQDLAGNRSDVYREFSVDNTPPQVALQSPADGALLGGENTLVPINGSVADANFAQYELSIRLAGTNDPWQVIATGAEIPVDILLANWTINVADGDYRLRLLATDQAGLEAVTSIGISIDTTPPLADITAPAAESLATLGTLIQGTASDANFKQYRVRVGDAAVASPLFSDVAIRDVEVNGGLLLEWTSLPPDGRYRLQLVVEDEVGLSATAETIVVVDQTPPEPPENLRAEQQPGFNVQLTWDAAVDDDLAGYLVYRNGVALNPSPQAETSYLDEDVPEGEQRYWVVAVDGAGNQSDPTNTETITIDRTPPDTVLISPAESARVRGQVEIVGTATSPEDFFEYRLYVRLDGSAGPGDLLVQSPTSVTGETLAVWDSTAVAQEQTYVFLLEAEDTSGNVGSVERRVVVDNLPPAAPTGLTAVIQGSNDADVNWNPNSESDLAGYLLYRDGQLVNANGSAGADLLPFALTDISYLDPAISDGTHVYQVFAIDVASNVSAGSNIAEVLVETGPPELFIVEPENNTRFEQPLRIVAQSEDLDIASVLFEYRAAASAVWTALGAPDTDVPYQATLDPVAEGLDFGDFQIRATATDTGGLTDPAPPVVDVVYADRTPPEDPFGLVVSVDGGDVSLSWQHPDTADVDEFLIYRGLPGEAPEDFEDYDAVAGTETSYIDTGLFDGDYRYYVTAVDLEFNESGATDVVSATVFTPIFVHPFTPTQVDTFSIAGVSAVAGEISGQLTSDAGTTAIGPLNTGGDGSFDLGTLPLVDGVNSLEFRITDSAGNVSKPGIAVIERGAPPSPPINPTTLVVGSDVTFSWEPPPETNVVGYRPFRDGQPLLDDEPVSGATFTASSNSGLAPRAGDNNSFTYWYPLDADLQNPPPAWIEAQFPQAELFTSVSIEWRFSRRPLDYTIEAWSGFVWVPVARVTQTCCGFDTVPLDQPYYTDRLRLVILDYNRGAFQPVRITEMDFERRALSTVTEFVESRPNGRFDYQATAVNDLGFESALSEIATAEVGDLEPPPAVVLSGSVSGSDAVLSWTESVAVDLAEYRLLRDGDLIFTQTDLATRDFVDPGLLNGTYSYEVLAVDDFGNVSAPSNTVTLTIAVDDVSPPQNLTVSLPPGGGALDLAWEQGPGLAPASYEIGRALQSGGPYEFAGDTAGDVTSYRDGGLENGTTYFYVVYAQDAVSNRSGPSNEASGTPLDDASPEPPVIISPTRAGQPVTLRALSTDVAGEAEPGVNVEIFRNGLLEGTVPAGADFELAFTELSQRVGGSQISPDGRFLAIGDSPTGIFSLATEEFTQFDFGFARITWAADSASVYVATSDFFGEVRQYSIDGQLLDTVVSGWGFISFAVASPDGQRVAIGGQTINPATGVSERGLYLLDRSDDSLVRIGDFDFGFTTLENIDWSGDGSQLVLVERSGTVDLQLYDVASDTLEVLQTSVSYRPPSFNSDDTQVAYTDQQVFVLDLASRISTQVSDGFTGYRQASWSPDDRFLAYGRSCCEIVVSDLATGEEVFSSDTDFIDGQRWVSTGRLLLLFRSDYATLSTPGAFLLEDMPLDGGDNEVTATAFDDSGNFSLPSQPILIQVPTDEFPDLAIGDLTVLPPGGAPGDSFQVNLLLRNLGLVEAPPAEISLRLLAPDGSSQELVAAQGPITLGPGVSQPFTINTGPLDVEGRYRLTAAIDLDNRIAESNENNNRAETAFQVTGSSLPLLTLRTDAAEFEPGAAVTGVVEVYNPGPLFSGRVEVTAEDADGFVFNFNQESPIQDLEFAQTEVVGVTWEPGNLFSGVYRLRATLFDLSGAAIQQATQEFTIARSAEFALSLSSIQTNFEPTALAEFEADLRFLDGNVAVQNASLQWQAIAPSGAVVWSETTDLGTLVPGFRGNVDQAWPVDGAATGTYRIRTELVSADAAAEAELLVNVVDPAAVLSLAGTITVDTPVIALGRLFDVSYQLDNVGGVAISSVPVSLRLLRTGSLAPLLTQDDTLDLAVGQRFDQTVSWDSAVLGFESYLIVLTADLSAQGGSADTILDSLSITGIDATPPELTVISPLDGSVTGADVQLSAEATDALSAVELVTARVDGAAEEPM